MNDFFGSKFVKDLQAGKLPPVEVKFSAESLVQVSAALFFTAVAIILVYQIAKKIGA
jgi:hypothetical protein